MEMMEEERMRTMEDKVMVRLCGLDNSPAGCDAITADPNLRRSRGGSGAGRGKTTTVRASESFQPSVSAVRSSHTQRV